MEGIHRWRLPSAARGVAGALSNLGYMTEVLSDASAQDIGSPVFELLISARREDIRIVHVVSHGEPGTVCSDVYVIGSDGRSHHTAAVEGWLKYVEDNPNGAPMTLFLLDICHAGRAARLPWEMDRDDEDHPPRAWVLAASGPDRQAFDCRLSHAVTQLLSEAADGTLGVDNAVEYLPWTLLRRRIRDLVNQLSVGAPGQRVTSTKVDDEFDLPFFPNPNYVPPTAVDTARAAAHSRDAVHRQRGCRRRAQAGVRHSSGRRRRTLHRPRRGAPTFAIQSRVVQRPGLREATKALWQHLEAVPRPLTSLVALHARQRSLTELASAIGQQLGLPSPDVGWGRPTFSLP